MQNRKYLISLTGLVILVIIVIFALSKPNRFETVFDNTESKRSKLTEEFNQLYPKEAPANTGIKEIELLAQPTEIELVDGSRLALTLVRSTGFLSRSDYPERPIHAGPFLETPGAQELNTEYCFNYSLLTHDANESLAFSADHAEVAALQAKSILFEKSKPQKEVLTPLIENNNPMIRISSLRTAGFGSMIIDSCDINISCCSSSVKSSYSSGNFFSICSFLYPSGSSIIRCRLSRIRSKLRRAA